MKLFSSHQSITPSDDVTSRPADTAAKYGEALAVLAPTPNHNLSVLAELLQTSNWRKWSLQEACKRQNGEFDPCRKPANVKMENLVLAGSLQTPKWRI